jgi:uncharacterized membrane protein YesL
VVWLDRTIQRKQSLATNVTTIIIMTMALVLLLSLPSLVNFVQAIVIALLHCSPEEQRSEDTALVHTVFG